MVDDLPFHTIGATRLCDARTPSPIPVDDREKEISHISRWTNWVPPSRRIDAVMRLGIPHRGLDCSMDFFLSDTGQGCRAKTILRKASSAGGRISGMGRVLVAWPLHGRRYSRSKRDGKCSARNRMRRLHLGCMPVFANPLSGCQLLGGPLHLRLDEYWMIDAKPRRTEQWRPADPAGPIETAVHEALRGCGSQRWI